MILTTYTLWILFLAVMCLKGARDRGTLPKPAYYFALPILGMGYALDFLVNMFIMTPLLFEFPKELLVTARCSRHKLFGEGRRKKIATWICENLLDPFDPSGCHCK